MKKWNYQQLQQEQNLRAEAIALIAKEFFQKQLAILSNPLEAEKGRVILKGKNYQLSFNSTTQKLSLTRANEKLKLMELDCPSNRIEIARGLTTEDVEKWQSIKSFNISNIKLLDRGMEL